MPPWQMWEEYVDAGNGLHTLQNAHVHGDACGACDADANSHGTPAMPCKFGESEHRPKIYHKDIPFNACVARPVNKAEIASVPSTQAAMKVDWGRLRTKHVWDESVVREWDDVAAEARNAGNEHNLPKRVA